MDVKQALLDDIERSVRGPAWHGPSLEENLEGVGAAAAAVRPPSGHSIWELVLHAAVWIDEVASRFRGSSHAEPEAGDWPSVQDTSEAAWQLARAWPGQALARLDDAVRAFPEDRLMMTVPNGATYLQMLMGLPQHNAYHSGQIALLRKISRRNPS
jgi:hypothetical protein